MNEMNDYMSSRNQKKENNIAIIVSLALVAIMIISFIMFF